MWFLVLLILFAFAMWLLYLGRPYWAWVAPLAVGFVAWGATGPALPFLFSLCLLVFAVLAVVFGLAPLRQQIVSARLMEIMSGILPRISDTERMALEAGTIWWDGDLFSGRPDWNKLAAFQPTPLSREEAAFLEGPVEEVCRMIDDDRAAREGDLSPEVWEYMKRHRFFGMIIPSEYGGLGFSAIAHSAVITKLASRSVAGAVTAMVPNSLGPAELLLHYGTDAQKDYYLPRLATGEEIPSFALTEPEAGSDAAGGKSTGIVSRGTFEGEEVLGMHLTWDKRYATLAPSATVLGLAFKLRDPDHLLGDKEELGITVALIPTRIPGVHVGDRHDPLGVPFLNGPSTGKDVFVPLEFIVGGPAMAGQGWRMLMECLAAGRSISLPALAVGAAEYAVRVTGAHATVREQFGLPIGRFEGIEERLGRIGGLAYLMNATRRLTAGAVDAGEKPSVLSAIVKAYLTELMRQVVNDSMDVLGGTGISRGPRNTMANAYASLPIGITVEGANILTRSLIVFGQGAIRCHPWVLEEIQAVADRDLARFDRAVFKHIGFVASNKVRSLILGLTAGRPVRPGLGGDLQPYFGQLSHMSAAYTFLADLMMATLGGNLKRKEMLSGRMADALAWMYLASATLKRYVDEGHPDEDRAAAQWGVQYALYRIQTALLEVLHNHPLRAMRALKVVLFPLGARYRPPSDRLTQQVARTLTEGREGRLRLTSDIFIPPPDEPGLGFLEATLEKVVASAPAVQKLHAAMKERRLPRADWMTLGRLGPEEGILTEEEGHLVRAAAEARLDYIQVDAFPPGFLTRLRDAGETTGVGA